MTRVAWLGVIAVAIAGAGVGYCIKQAQPLPPRPAAERPTLALLTSLPLVFAERFGLDNAGSPALTRLEQRYKVQPIAVADAANLKGRKLLLMAHPRAQPAEALVELDQWVRSGGHVLLLADPNLRWPSERPLGDKLRPPPAFADTGLLNHWGVTTVGPVAGESAGRLTSKHCEITGDGVVARCSIGRGKATIIGDADFINVESSDSGYLGSLIGELALLETR